MKKIIGVITGLILVGTVSVSAQISEPDPIIIVPGIGASWHWSTMLNAPGSVFADGWQFTPGMKQYNQLIQSFVDAGFVEDEDFFVAFYDWRQSNADSAVNYLIPTINRALANSSTGKVDIVAHSMGGLVARSYIQSNSYGNNVDQFIMLGTPNGGSSDVYTLWEGGEVPGNWEQSLRSALGSFLWISSNLVDLTFDTYDTIQQFVPSIQELLPTYDYLVDKDSGVITAVSDMQERNLFLSALNLESNKTKLLERLPGRVSIIAGEGENTVGNITVGPQDPTDDPKLWKDGKPDPISPVKNDLGGDNRVLLSSALLEVEVGFPVESLQDIRETWWSKFTKLLVPVANAQFFPPFVEPISFQTIEAKHGDLPTQSIPEIFSILGMGAPSVDYEPIPEPDSILTFWFASPIEVQVTSPSGDVTTQEVDGIAGSTYDGASDPLGFKMVVIENPEIGEYLVELLGLAIGDYTMGVGSFSDSGDFDITTQGDVVEGERIGYTVLYSGDGSVEVSDSFIIDENVFEKFRNAVGETAFKKKKTKKRLIKYTNKAEKAFNAGKFKKAEKILHKIEKILKKAHKKHAGEDDLEVLEELLEEIEEFIEDAEDDFYEKHDEEHDN